MLSEISVQPTVAASLGADLREWTPLTSAQRDLAAEYLAFIAVGAAALDRDGGPEHVTASSFVFTDDLSRVLLTFHKKGQFWVQLGGHIEGADASVAAAALREAHEEGGILQLEAVGNMPVDVDRHALGSGFRCAAHWDIGYAFIAPTNSSPTISDESEDVAWWPVDGLPQNVPTGFPDRLRGVLNVLAARHA